MGIGTAGAGAVVVAVELAAGGGAGCPHEVVAATANRTVPTAQSRVRRDRDTVTRSTVVDCDDVADCGQYMRQ
ncbi:hypothetical protein FPV58_23360 [Mycolicibacterium porcinum]|nr:hypothetical protein FPV58_23360 [Mycolicibacterium porcinum]